MVGVEWEHVEIAPARSNGYSAKTGAKWEKQEGPIFSIILKRKMFGYS